VRFGIDFNRRGGFQPRRGFPSFCFLLGVVVCDLFTVVFLYVGIALVICGSVLCPGLFVVIRTGYGVTSTWGCVVIAVL